jgi:hypothetical protein
VRAHPCATLDGRPPTPPPALPCTSLAVAALTISIRVTAAISSPRRRDRREGRTAGPARLLRQHRQPLELKALHAAIIGRPHGSPVAIMGWKLHRWTPCSRGQARVSTTATTVAPSWAMSYSMSAERCSPRQASSPSSTQTSCPQLDLIKRGRFKAARRGPWKKPGKYGQRAACYRIPRRGRRRAAPCKCRPARDAGRREHLDMDAAPGLGRKAMKLASGTRSARPFRPKSPVTKVPALLSGSRLQYPVADATIVSRWHNDNEQPS